MYKHGAFPQDGECCDNSCKMSQENSLTEVKFFLFSLHN